MKSLKAFLSAALLAVAATASAQFVGGGGNNGASSHSGSALVKDCDNYNRIYFGYSPVVVSYDSKHYSESVSVQGFQVGWTGGYNITGNKLPLFLEAGANLQFNTGKDIYAKIADDYSSPDSDEPNDYTRTNMLSIGIPINISYKLTFKNGVYLAPYAGIHFKMNLLGVQKPHFDKDWYEDEYDADWKDIKKVVKQYTGIDPEKSLNCFDKDDMGKDLTWKRFQMGYQVGANLGYKAFNFGVGYSGEFMELCKDTKTGGVVVNLGYNF